VKAGLEGVLHGPVDLLPGGEPAALQLEQHPEERRADQPGERHQGRQAAREGADPLIEVHAAEQPAVADQPGEHGRRRRSGQRRGGGRQHQPPPGRAPRVRQPATPARDALPRRARRAARRAPADEGGAHGADQQDVGAEQREEADSLPQVEREIQQRCVEPVPERQAREHQEHGGGQRQDRQARRQQHPRAPLGAGAARRRRQQRRPVQPPAAGAEGDGEAEQVEVRLGAGARDRQGLRRVGRLRLLRSDQLLEGHDPLRLVLGTLAGIGGGGHATDRPERVVADHRDPDRAGVGVRERIESGGAEQLDGSLVDPVLEGAGEVPGRVSLGRGALAPGLPGGEQGRARDDGHAIQRRVHLRMQEELVGVEGEEGDVAGLAAEAVGEEQRVADVGGHDADVADSVAGDGIDEAGDGELVIGRGQRAELGDQVHAQPPVGQLELQIGAGRLRGDLGGIGLRLVQAGRGAGGADGGDVAREAQDRDARRHRRGLALRAPLGGGAGGGVAPRRVAGIAAREALGVFLPGGLSRGGLALPDALSEGGVELGDQQHSVQVPAQPPVELVEGRLEQHVERHDGAVESDRRGRGEPQRLLQARRRGGARHDLERRRRLVRMLRQPGLQADPQRDRRAGVGGSQDPERPLIGAARQVADEPQRLGEGGLVDAGLGGLADQEHPHQLGHPPRQADLPPEAAEEQQARRRPVALLLDRLGIVPRDPAAVLQVARAAAVRVREPLLDGVDGLVEGGRQLGIERVGHQGDQELQLVALGLQSAALRHHLPGRVADALDRALPVQVLDRGQAQELVVEAQRLTPGRPSRRIARRGIALGRAPGIAGACSLGVGLLAVLALLLAGTRGVRPDGAARAGRRRRAHRLRLPRPAAAGCDALLDGALDGAPAGGAAPRDQPRTARTPTTSTGTVGRFVMTPLFP